MFTTQSVSGHEAISLPAVRPGMGVERVAGFGDDDAVQRPGGSRSIPSLSLVP
jgi:hypothetical protein